MQHSCTQADSSYREQGTLLFRRAGFIALSLALTIAMPAVLAAQADWPQFGQNAANTADNQNESTISPDTAPKLKPKWKFSAKGDVSARAAVVDGVVYFPDWGGWLWALNAASGKVIWSKQLSSYSLANPSSGKPLTTVVSRNTPAVADGVLYLGTIEGGWFLAINAKTGALLWKERPEADDSAQLTGSPAYAAGLVYVGVTSNEEGVTGNKPRTARGSVVALEASSGHVQWQTYMTVAGYSGVGVWGSNPVVDESRGSVFVGTGDNYEEPTDPSYLSCIQTGGKPSTCQSPQNFVDSVVALDMYSGKVKWAQKLVTWPEEKSQSGADMFNLSCIHQGDSGCPSPEGPDFDFGSAPNEIAYANNQGSGTILGIGQKSGIYYALDPDNGNLVWQKQVGPGSRSGGILWGSAADKTRIYVAIGNPFGASYGSTKKALGTAGTWAAINPADGKILWQVPDPSGAIDIGAMTVANGVVYAPSTAHGSSDPTMIALDAAHGNTLWKYAGGASTIAGATVVNGMVYWGSGYSRLGSPYTGNHMLYAFSIDGK